MNPDHLPGACGKVLVYDFNSSGHCPGWMHLVATGFRQAGADVLVACRLETPEVRTWADRLAAEGCRVIAMPEGDDVCHATDAAALARREGIRRVFFTNFDSVVYEMGKRRICGALEGLDIGGIWLRPELTPFRRGPLRRMVEKLIRTRANKLRRKQARAVHNNLRGLGGFLPPARKVASLRLFFTSEAAAIEVGKLLPGETRQLCDPWLTRCEISRSEARARLDLDDSRVILLHLGTSRPEKGLKDACDALLSFDDNLLQTLLLLRAGKVDRSDVPRLRQLEKRGGAHSIDRYLGEEELACCYAACDWVLLPYRNQSETSGVLIHAAAHARPVIASDYGWIGQSTRDHELGLLFRHTDTVSLAEQLAKVAKGDIHDWSAAGMERFADANSPESFQNTLVTQWLLEDDTPCRDVPPQPTDQ